MCSFIEGLSQNVEALSLNLAQKITWKQDKTNHNSIQIFISMLIKCFSFSIKQKKIISEINRSIVITNLVYVLHHGRNVAIHLEKFHQHLIIFL